MANPRTEIMVPIVPTNGIDMMPLNFTLVFTAEARAEEIAALTPHKAPELLVLFNRGYLDLSNMLSQLKLAQARAEDEVFKIKATILLERCSQIIKDKKLASSADVRQAIIDLDPEYQGAKERLDFIEATLEYVKGKMKFMENAHSAVKKIMSDQNWNMAGRRDLGSLFPEKAEAGQSVHQGLFGEPLVK